MQRDVWVKSTKSGAAGHCVQVRHSGTDVLVRDSKWGEASAVLTFTEAEWRAFLAGAADGEFTL
jgi:hypothetical protein